MIVPSQTNSTINNEYFSGEESYKYYNQFIWKDRYAECTDIDKVINMLSSKDY